MAIEISLVVDKPVQLSLSVRPATYEIDSTAPPKWIAIADAAPTSGVLYWMVKLTWGKPVVGPVLASWDDETGILASWDDETGMTYAVETGCGTCMTHYCPAVAPALPVGWEKIVGSDIAPGRRTPIVDLGM